MQTAKVAIEKVVIHSYKIHHTHTHTHTKNRIVEQLFLDLLNKFCAHCGFSPLIAIEYSMQNGPIEWKWNTGNGKKMK